MAVPTEQEEWQWQLTHWEGLWVCKQAPNSQREQLSHGLPELFLQSKRSGCSSSGGDGRGSLSESG